MQLREQAAAMGADAVFLGNADDYPVGAVVNLPEPIRHSRAGAMGDLPGEASWQSLLWLVRAPHAKTTPSTDPSSPVSTGIAIAYQ